MSLRLRIVVAAGLLLVIAGAILGVEALRRRSGEAAIPAGSIPVYLDGKRVAAFAPGDLERLEKVSFIETAEGKTQEGWRLSDVILLYIDAATLNADTLVTVKSSSRSKSAVLTWPEVADPANWVMFDLSNRGTLKLVSVLEKLDTRDEWVQDIDSIEITLP